MAVCETVMKYSYLDYLSWLHHVSLTECNTAFITKSRTLSPESRVCIPSVVWFRPTKALRQRLGKDSFRLRNSNDI